MRSIANSFQTGTAAALRPHIEARLAGVQGAIASTDAFRAYAGIMQSLGATHDVVKHSQKFRDPVTGVHTNSVEDMHNVMKRDRRVQFCSLPSVEAAKVQYLDLVVWRANVRLATKSNGEKSQLMTKFMHELCSWHPEQLADFEPCSVHVIDQPSMVPSEDEISEEDNKSEGTSDTDGDVREEVRTMEMEERELAESELAEEEEEEPLASDGLEVPMEVGEPSPAQPAEPAEPAEEEVEVGMVVPSLCHHPCAR